MPWLDRILVYLPDPMWFSFVILLWVLLVAGELQAIYRDWMVCRIARAREAELRKAGLIR